MWPRHLTSLPMWPCKSTQQCSVPSLPHLDVPSQLVLRSQRPSTSTSTHNEFVKNKQTTGGASNVKFETTASQQSGNDSVSDIGSSDAIHTQPLRHSDTHRVGVEFRQRYEELLQEMLYSKEPKQCLLCHGVFHKASNFIYHVKKYHEEHVRGGYDVRNAKQFATQSKPWKGTGDTIIEYPNGNTSAQFAVNRLKCFFTLNAIWNHTMKKHWNAMNAIGILVGLGVWRDTSAAFIVNLGDILSAVIVVAHLTNRMFLVNHLKLHSNEKECLCDVCGKTFHHKSQLLIHKRNHSEEKGLCMWSMLQDIQPTFRSGYTHAGSHGSKAI